MRTFGSLDENALCFGMIMHRIQGFVWIACTADFELHPRETKQNGKCQGLVSFVVFWCAKNSMEEVIALARLLGCLEA